MTRIIAFENLSLDGVMQAPGRPDEDRRGGFTHGGWAMPYADPAIGKAAQESMTKTGGLLLGRRTYEDFHGFWQENRRTTPSPRSWTNSLEYRRLDDPARAPSVEELEAAHR